MKNEFSAIVEPGDDRWFMAQSPEVPGANGQGGTPGEAVEDLSEAITLVLEYLRAEAAESASPAAIRMLVTAS